MLPPTAQVRDAMAAPFPAGKYARYKRATAFFLDWLLRARGRGQHAGARVELKTLDDVVHGIAAQPTSLTPKLLRELPKALAACQCAITLREHVAAFFAEDDAAQQGHRHFLELLKSWHKALMHADTEAADDDELLEMESAKLAMELESTRFESYYEVLQVDEDYFPDEDTAVQPGAPKTTKADRKILFDEAFAEDLRLEVVYFFLELEELVEGVFTIYDQVKKQQRTMVEATVVVKLAMDSAKALTAKLQLRYPALKTAEDVFNIVTTKKAATGSGYDPSGLTGSFMALMDEFFTSRKVTVPMVFTCVCWMKAVAALQGDAGLSRNMSLMFKHSTKLMKNLDVSYSKGAVRVNDQEIHDLLKHCSDEIQQSNKDRHLERANPLLAGLKMLSHHLQYLNLGGEVIMVTSRFRAFGHLYHALITQGFLQHIPFFDEVLSIYDQMIFTPSRAAAVHGAFNRTYSLSSHMTAASVNAIKAADLCSRELFQSRVLSRDILKLNDDLTDAFSEMCDKLYRRQYHDDYIARRTPGDSRQYRVNRALEDAVMSHLMPLLDCLQRDGSLDLRALPTGANAIQRGRLDGEIVKVMCRKTAAVIKAKFATPSLICEKKYFTFPLRPDYINQEYGTVSFKKLTGGQNRENVFCDLMDILEDSDGPLSEQDLNTIKTEIKRDPELLNMLSLRSLSGADPSVFNPHNLATAPRDDLSTLLHQAAAGSAHDAELVEWMIQMGALVIQPTLHCRSDVRQSNLRCPRDDLCRTMAVHSAAIAGHEDIVRIILEADNMVDLNTRTYDTKKTLAHLAVKHGHLGLYRMLAALGADLRIKDANGKRVCDLTADRAWARDIADSIATLEGSQARSENTRSRDAQFRHEGSRRAERLRKSIAAQCDEERQRVFSNAEANTSNAAKKQGKRKGKKNKKGKGQGSAGTPNIVSSQVGEEDDTANTLEHLLSFTETDGIDAPKHLTVLDDSLENTAAMFARLRDLSIPADSKLADAKRSCELIEKVEGIVELSSHASRVNSTDRRLRMMIASEASQVIHMMQKLHRIDHAAITAPALAAVQTLCNTTMEFTKFVVGTAQLCVSVDRKPQAREILDVLEKRLLKTPFGKREPGAFRELVQTYSGARNGMGMGRTASPDSLRALEWYLMPTVDRYEVQVKLDGMGGRPFYFDLATSASTAQFSVFAGAIHASADMNGVACFDKRVQPLATRRQAGVVPPECAFDNPRATAEAPRGMAAFPASKYARYKRATAFFLDWLLRARGRGRRARSKRVQLDEFNEVVEEIAASPSMLTPKLLQELPKALAACQCAITFREHVATFFAEDDEAQVGHWHFLELLKDWYQTLKRMETEQRDAAFAAGKVQSEKFENYYKVLEVDEDYFPDEDVFVKERDAPKRAKADRKRLFDQAFDEDLRLEVAYFFLELEELVEEVFNVYDQVKKQQRTMVEATVVVKIAMDLADALTAGLQVRYPALQTAEDLLFVLMDNPSTTLKDQIAKASHDIREEFKKNGTYTFSRGMLLSDFTTVWWTLVSFSSTVGVQEDKKDLYWNLVSIPEEYIGERYGEERTPQHILPDSDNTVLFLMQQLPMMYNAIRSKTKNAKSYYKRGELVGTFMALFEEYFQSRKVTVPLVFVCICWIKSVVALQGDMGLSRNVSLTFQHSKSLVKNMEAALMKGGASLDGLIQECADGIKNSTRGHALARMNPLLAGFMMVTHHMKYLLLASGELFRTSRLRAFGHLYVALTEQGFLDNVPFIDNLLQMYENFIFTPSRSAAVHGSYNRAYLLSDHYTTDAVNSIYRGVLLPRSKWFTKDKMEFTEDLSNTFRLVIEQNMSCLGSTSPKVMLQKAADICFSELFDTRILSRDLMTLNDDLAEVFSDMCDALGQREFHNELAADREREQSRSDNVKEVPVTAVMFPLLPLLDSLQPDGSMNWDVVPVGMLTRSCDGGRVRAKSEKVAAVIKAKFLFPALICEHRYFMFPLQPNFVAQQYGIATFKQKPNGEGRDIVFNELMDLLKASDGPLSNTDLNRLKSEIKKDPGLLGMVSYSTMSGPAQLASRPDDDLCTLLHQAAAGPAHDVDLVEWMIQMGGLLNQPSHCRDGSSVGQDGPCQVVPNTMAVHSAVIAGHKTIARVMLEADNLVDLNTPTFHTKETLCHLAVKHGHRDILSLLRCFGANVYIKNGSDEQIVDLVAAQGWFDESTEISASMSMLQDDTHHVMGGEAIQRQVSVRAERLRKLIFAQRNEEHQFALQKVSRALHKSKSKTNTSDIVTSAVEPNSISSHMDLKTNQPSVAGGSSLEKSLAKTAAVFARLRNTSVPGADKVGDVESACIAVKKLQGLTELLSRPEKLKTSQPQLRRAVSFEAYRVIHMADKFYRVDHVAIRAPELSSLRKLCETTSVFTKFVLSTAELCVSVGRVSQARELFDLLEKRLLKIPIAKREPLEFRKMVQSYSTIRNTQGLGHTSSPGALRKLEWYMSDRVDNDALLLKLDGLAGYPFYFKFCACVSDHDFDTLRAALSTICELDRVVFLLSKNGKFVIFGGKNLNVVKTASKLLLDISGGLGIQFSNVSSQPLASAIDIEEFEFSAAGVFRIAASA
ncbi:unnamed protein product [Phytophthora fragariaefolia]|uniref:Unnamed protein product n=1 Tax=Phytophthora fragariaefolia TaxID=1490495 RepID=A0A9W6X338_9STRA|nr:unnamed protein product [Phytophthora fragariaefolia]